MTINDFIAGWAAGGAGIIFGHPLDTVKTRLQTSTQYKGIVDCFTKTLKKEGVFGLYKGLTFPCLSAGCLHSVLFAGYGTALHLMHPGETDVESRKDLPLREILLASICGTMLQLVPAIPVELIKTKLQVQQESYTTGKAYRGPAHVATSLYKKGGVRGLYQGGSVMFCRDNIGYLFYLPVYETVCQQLRKQGVGDTTSQVLAGGCAGAAGWVSICPIEVVKNRIQTTHVGKSVKEVVMEIVQKEGLRAFFKGGLTMTIRGFPANAIIFVVYEKSLSYLGGQN